MVLQTTLLVVQRRSKILCRLLQFLESGGLKFYHRLLMKDTEAWERMTELFDNFCKGKDIIIQDAYAIYNPTLVTAFIQHL